ncbi:uncharacterized protein CTHT_0018960 [Thermochaetoides thermophila DSM 1495]|uniref:Uncharacterized protein n=1 Tax=Chaetomium thermophilum (strain DSM 1495 / CBS 144.50 / IMI 039719) TaxID=759272 RepID=G0S2Y7_CHATD|nr:hypothetical protein CTHT_0018960 [Thermochaetoides thermophila DSM 1495]EGS22370.1 hypothetical protein CTHT_0018960 [Thermochaetoides thermophila DSM 1495]
MTETVLPTPSKRKRDDMLNDGMSRLHITPYPYTFSLSVPTASTDRGDNGHRAHAGTCLSPRTQVAHEFRGMAVGGGGDDNACSSSSQQTSGVVGATGSGGGGGGGVGCCGGTAGEDPIGIDTEEGGHRKRIRLPPPEIDMRDADAEVKYSLVTDTPAIAITNRASIETAEQNASSTAYLPQTPRPIHIALDDAVVRQSEPTPTTLTLPPSSPLLPADHTPMTLAKHRKRPAPYTAKLLATHPRNPFNLAANTPAPAAKRPAGTAASVAARRKITDPLRASLTWRDDEITIYDPNDSDDDGTGINGIGFKPTPAMAQARLMRRRQQLAEYRKRVESEARRERLMRRGGIVKDAAPPPPPPPPAKKEKAVRRVRFVEAAVVGV